MSIERGSVKGKLVSLHSGSSEDLGAQGTHWGRWGSFAQLLPSTRPSGVLIKTGARGVGVSWGVGGSVLQPGHSVLQSGLCSSLRLFAQ